MLRILSSQGTLPLRLSSLYIDWTPPFHSRTCVDFLFSLALKCLTQFGIHLSQHKYARDLILKYSLLDSKHMSTPMVSGKHISKLANLKVLLKDLSEYWSAVGALQYLTFTWHEISFAVNRLCQFMTQSIGLLWNVYFALSMERSFMVCLWYLLH